MSRRPDDIPRRAARAGCLTLCRALVVAAGCAAPIANRAGGTAAPLVIREQGSFAVGGTVVTTPGTFDPIAQGAPTPAPDPTGQTLHGDHAYVSYQIPVNARRLPLVFWHGRGQSAKTWETTPDGREGFRTIFLRRRFPVYLIDQPRRGRAGRSTQPVSIPATPDEQTWFGIFRLGAWPTLYPGVQFSPDSSALDQLFRQMVPDTGPSCPTRPPGTSCSPTGRRRRCRCAVARSRPPTIPMSDFMQLTKIPIVIYYGDDIPEQSSTNPGQEQWRVFLAVARRWRDAVNRRGGDVTVVHLPEVGIRGNTHFPMSDLNNVAIANLLSELLRQKGLD